MKRILLVHRDGWAGKGVVVRLSYNNIVHVEEFPRLLHTVLNAHLWHLVDGAGGDTLSDTKLPLYRVDLPAHFLVVKLGSQVFIKLFHLASISITYEVLTRTIL